MTTVPEEAVKAPERIRVAQDAEGFWTCREAVSGSTEYVRADLALPHLPQGVGVKKLDLTILERLAEYAEQYDHPDENGPFPDIQDAMVTVGDLRQARKLLSLLSALEPSAADCPCTLIQQDETCLVGYPSLLCEICDGKGVVQPSAARELALEEAEHAVGSTVLKHKPSDYDGLDSLEAYEAGQLNGLESAQASLRTLGTSREQLNKAVSNVPDQQENEPGAHGERERALEEAAKIAEQFRNNDWIAHDMRTGVFPTQSEPGIAIAAAIRALAHAGKVEGDGWLPIESAPKDGTIVLLGWNDPDIEEIGAVAGWYEGGPADKCWYDQYHEPVTATHWMPLRPLPSAPSQEVAGS